MIRSIVFDLGNVILGFGNTLILSRLSRLTSVPPEEFLRFIFKDDLESRFDCGMVSPEDFFRTVQERFALPVTYEEFKQLFCDIFTPVPGMEQLVRSLKKDYRLSLLSNTNALHFEFAQKKFPVIDEFGHFFLSYELGMRKPDRKIFQKVIDYYGCAPQEIMYTDDISEYVAAAQGLGIHAVRFTGTMPFVQELRSAGVSVPDYGRI
jgi:putative hydrolase of the HAD superfamily